MTEAMKTLARLKKASKLTRLAFHKNGPKSFKRGQGALLKFLLEDDSATQRELVKKLGVDRRELKGIVKKAERNGYITIEEAEGERTYAVKLTDEGKKDCREARRGERGDCRGYSWLPERRGSRPAQCYYRKAYRLYQGERRQRQEEGPQSSSLPRPSPSSPLIKDQRFKLVCGVFEGTRFSRPFFFCRDFVFNTYKI